MGHEPDQRLERPAADEALEEDVLEDRDRDVAADEERDRRQERHRPAQERPGEHADGREDHRLQPDAEQAPHEVDAEVVGLREDVEVALRHAHVLGRRGATDLELHRPLAADQVRRGHQLLVGVVLADREGVGPRGDARPLVGRGDLGVDGLADLALGGPVDGEGHLDGDGRRVERGGLLAEAVGVVRLAGLVCGVGLGLEVGGLGLELLGLRAVAVDLGAVALGVLQVDRLVLQPLDGGRGQERADRDAAVEDHRRVERVGDDTVPPDGGRRGGPFDVRPEFEFLADVDAPGLGGPARVDEGERALDRHAGRHAGAELLGLVEQELRSGRVGRLERDGLFLGRADGRTDVTRQVDQAHRAEDRDEDRDDRHVAEDPAPDQLDAPDGLGDDRVDRLELDVLRQADGGEDGHHDGEQQRAEQRQGPDVEPAEFGRAGRGGLEEPVGEGQDDREDREHDVRRLHAAGRLDHRVLGDGVEPLGPHPEDLGQEHPDDLGQHDEAHVRRTQAGAVRGGHAPARDHVIVQAAEQERDPDAQPERDVQAVEDGEVRRGADLPDHAPEDPLDPDQKDHAEEDREQGRDRERPDREGRDPLGGFEDVDQDGEHAQEQTGEGGVVEPVPLDADALADGPHHPADDPGQEAEEAEDLDPGDERAERTGDGEVGVAEDEQPLEDADDDRARGAGGGRRGGAGGLGRGPPGRARRGGRPLGLGPEQEDRERGEHCYGTPQRPGSARRGPGRAGVARGTGRLRMDRMDESRCCPSRRVGRCRDPADRAIRQDFAGLPAKSSAAGVAGLLASAPTRRRPGCRSLSRTIRRKSSSRVVVGWSTATSSPPWRWITARISSIAESGSSRVLIWVMSWTVSRSVTLPISLSSPRWRIAIRSQMSCMSARRWPDRRIVLPFSRRSRISSLISAVPIGSRPEVGSSRRISSGSLMSAWANPMRRCMPLEYSRSWRCLAAFRPTMSIRRPTRFLRSDEGILKSRP